MQSIKTRLVRILLAIFLGAMCTVTAALADERQEAIKLTVTGQKIQEVGFRAMIQKQAIMYNVAGSARNNADGTVAVTLQGNEDRIEKILEAIRAGNKKSSTSNSINESPVALDPTLSTFTVFQWTSQSRDIRNPYDLVFRLRPSNDVISAKDAKESWNAIAEGTLQGDDRIKFVKHLEDDN